MEPDIALIAKLIGDSTRASMLTALMGGKALTATELAIEADITAPTASSHLSKLVDGQLLIMRKQGRHKYFQLRGTEVAELIEKLLNLSSKIITNRVVTGPQDSRLRKARVCYDHLAGEQGVALYDALVSKNLIVDKRDETILTASGKDFFKDKCVDFTLLNKSKRPQCKSCLDWSERRNHLAGTLGQWILEDIYKKGWASKSLDSRAVEFSDKGLRLFSKNYAILNDQ